MNSETTFSNWHRVAFAPPESGAGKGELGGSTGSSLTVGGRLTEALNAGIGAELAKKVGRCGFNVYSLYGFHKYCNHLFPGTSMPTIA